MSSTASATRSHRVPTPARSWPLATAALGAIVLAATTAALGARLVVLWPDLMTAARQWSTPSALAIDTLVAAPLLAAGTALAAWWTLSLLLITASLIADRAGVRSVALLRCIHVLAPRALRQLAVAGVGAGLTLSVLPAQAAEAPPDLGWTTAVPAGPAHPDLRAAADLPVHADSTARTDPAAGPHPVASAPPTPTPNGAEHSGPVDPTSLGTPVPREAVVTPTPAPDQAETEHGTGAQGPASAHPDRPQPSAAPTPAPPAPAPPVPAPAAQSPTAPSPAAPRATAPSPAAPSPSAPSPSAPSPGASSPAAPLPAAPSPAGDLRPDLEPGVIVVAPQDTLWDLAAAALPPGASNADVATSWHAWYALNVAVIGADPDLLHPGQILQVPRAA